MWCLIRCHQRPHYAWIIGFGITALMTMMSCMYYGVFQILLLGPAAAVCFISDAWYRNRQLLRAWFLITLIIVLVTACISVRYKLVYESEDFYRRFSEVISGSAHPSDWFGVSPYHWSAILPGLHEAQVEFALFPGFLFCVASLYSLFAGFQRTHLVNWVLEHVRVVRVWLQRQWDLAAGFLVSSLIILYWLLRAPIGICRVHLKYDYFTARWPAVSGSLLLVIAVAAAVGMLPHALRTRWLQQRSIVFWCWIGVILIALCSFGPLISTHDHELAIGPYAALYRFLPGFTSIRVPARICFLLMPLLVLLSTHGLVSLQERSVGKRGLAVLSGVILTAIAGDLATKPIPWQRVPIGGNVPAAIQWLRQNPEPGAVVAVPPCDFGDPEQLYYATLHGRPIMNGYGGYCPSEATRALTRIRCFPDPAALDVLRKRSIRFVLVNMEEMRRVHGPELETECDQSPELRRVFTELNGPYVIYEVAQVSM